MAVYMLSSFGKCPFAERTCRRLRITLVPLLPCCGLAFGRLSDSIFFYSEKSVHRGRES